ncbi:hypothetical protein [Micromonospora globbae]|uniref:hypothetical protein n=1 Tax=Micromonospora globbae TaxID=1894969 RepID=UPI003448D246|nr:hypothetical protein OH732_04975 [Micromonospora globbae]
MPGRTARGGPGGPDRVPVRFPPAVPEVTTRPAGLRRTRYVVGVQATEQVRR